MRTTLVLHDPIYRRAQRQARQRHVALSSLMNQALDRYLAELESESARSAVPSLDLPSFDLGTPAVDINDRDALLRRMEEQA